METKLKTFQKAIQESQKIVFFGGAGVSTESGIPDFRSADGIFMQKTEQTYSPETIISKSFYQHYPKEFFDFHFNHLVYPEAQPNQTHKFLVTLEQLGKDVSVVTQNIDGLHQMAGSSKVYELHGTVYKNHCEGCHQEYTLDSLQIDDQGIPRCPLDGGIVRPNIVMYEEELDDQVVMDSIQALSQADLLIVAGTSLIVYPAASFIQYFRGKDLVVINRTPIQVFRPDALVFEESLANVLSQINL